MGKRRVLRGHLGEVVSLIPGRHSVAWMMAWRCRKCGHAWPIRLRRDHQKRLAEALGTGAEFGKVEEWADLRKRMFQEIRGHRPTKCAGCDATDWWRPYLVGPKRGPRQPTKLWGWRARFGKPRKGDPGGSGEQQ